MGRLAVQTTFWEDVEIFTEALRPEITRSSSIGRYTEISGNESTIADCPS